MTVFSTTVLSSVHSNCFLVSVLDIPVKHKEGFSIRTSSKATFKHFSYDLSHIAFCVHMFTPRGRCSSRREKDACRGAVRGGKEQREEGERAGRITDRVELLEQRRAAVRV